MASVAAPWRPAPPTLAGVADPDGPAGYPVDLLAGCNDALVLFSALWFGRQDAYWIADAGLAGTCVDVDGRRLDEMRRLYPAGWEFVEADAFEFARSAERRWDVVSLDPHTGLFDRCATEIDVWCSLAREMVILGSGRSTRVLAPDGWRIAGRTRRSDFRGGVFWTVLERAPESGVAA